MLFVSGLMGPYMSPIPAVASAAMIFSFFVAVMITPWLMLKIAGPAHAGHHAADGSEHPGGGLGRAYAAVARPILRSKGRSALFLLAVAVLSFGSLTLLYTARRHRQAAAVRQQVPAFDRHRHARGRIGRGDRRRSRSAPPGSPSRCPR